MTVFFKDCSGNLIYEEDFCPIAHDNVLKPNYIFQMRDPYYFFDVPSEWACWTKGSAFIEISKVELEILEEENRINLP